MIEIDFASEGEIAKFTKESNFDSLDYKSIPFITNKYQKRWEVN